MKRSLLSKQKKKKASLRNLIKQTLGITEVECSKCLLNHFKLQLSILSKKYEFVEMGQNWISNPWP